jgi:ribosomal protein S18 acetylase RimI-like enzyme
MTLIIRPYEKADRAFAVDLFVELNRLEYGISGDRKTDEETALACVAEAENLVTEGDSVILVALEDGTPAGLMIWAFGNDDIFIEETVREFGRVSDIVVAEAYRGRGIGRALLTEAESLTRSRGLRRLRLSVLAGNRNALAAYERFGFKHYSSTMIKELD